MWWGPALLQLAEHCLPMGNRELIPCFDYLVCVAFVLFVKMSSSQLLNSLAFTYPILSLMGSERAAAWGLASSWGYTTTSSKLRSKPELYSSAEEQGKKESSLLPKFLCSEDNETSTCS